MKQKTHSGAKKRIKIRKGGKVYVDKSCKNHLLSNKSKRQKNIVNMPVAKTIMKQMRRLLPGKIKLSKQSK